LVVLRMSNTDTKIEPKEKEGSYHLNTTTTYME